MKQLAAAWSSFACTVRCGVLTAALDQMLKKIVVWM